MKRWTTVTKLAGVVALLGLNDCSFDGYWGPYSCGDCVRSCARTDTVGLHTAEWDFESDCVGPTCRVRATNGRGVSIGASFHPGNRALHVESGSTAELSFTLVGFSDGARVSMNVRCEEGATLYLGVAGERLRTTGAVEVPTRALWTRIERTMAMSRETLPSIESARHGTTEVSMSIGVAGSGECVVDRLRYTGTVNACVEYSCSRSTCYDPPYAQDASVQE